MSQIHWLILVVLSPPSLKSLTLPFCDHSPVAVLNMKKRLNLRSEVMMALDALQTHADTGFQWKGQ